MQATSADELESQTQSQSPNRRQRNNKRSRCRHNNSSHRRSQISLDSSDVHFEHSPLHHRYITSAWQDYCCCSTLLCLSCKNEQEGAFVIPPGAHHGPLVTIDTSVTQPHPQPQPQPHQPLEGEGCEHTNQEEQTIVGFSPVCKAVYKCLWRRHFWYYRQLWHVSSGRVVAIHATPRIFHQTQDHNHTHLEQVKEEEEGEEEEVDDDSDVKLVKNNCTSNNYLLSEGHSNWFPERLGALIARTEYWCDIMNLSPPDGLFLQEFQKALMVLHEKNKPIVVRMMFGHIIGMPVRCRALLDQLTAGIPKKSTQLKVWVGAWRKGLSSWNHAKLIAVDGSYLFTGGHNFWDAHYLRTNPVLDLSIELEGTVAQDAHYFANDHWRFLEKLDKSLIGQVMNQILDYLPILLKSRVSLRRFPPSCPRHPPNYHSKRVRMTMRLTPRLKQNPVLSMGRGGKLTRFKRRPSDDAIVAMLEAASSSIKLALQDLGPICIPGTKITVPGCVWPKAYLNALGRVIWSKNVTVDIILSNPWSVPHDLTLMEAVYGNGWTCVDVAAEIIKAIKQQFPSADDHCLRRIVSNNLRVCYLRGPDGQRTWTSDTLHEHQEQEHQKQEEPQPHGEGDQDEPNGRSSKDSDVIRGKATRAFHPKHFIIDDICYYIGSQNLYIADLAEWGVLVDNVEATKAILKEFWNPLWQQSYSPEDCNVQEVMDGLSIERDGEHPKHVSEATQKLMDSMLVREASSRTFPREGRGHRLSMLDANIAAEGIYSSIYQQQLFDLYEFFEKEEDDDDEEEDEIEVEGLDASVASRPQSKSFRTIRQFRFSSTRKAVRRSSI